MNLRHALPYILVAAVTLWVTIYFDHPLYAVLPLIVVGFLFFIDWDDRR